MVPEKLSAIRRCPLFGVSAIRRVLKYGIYGKRSWYIAHCPLYGRCPLFGSLVPRPLPLIKMRAGRGSGGMTRFLTDPRRNAGAHSIAIVLSS